MAQDILEFPFLGVLADGAGTDEEAGFDGDAGELGGLGDRPDVDHQRAGRAVSPRIPLFRTARAELS